jgi:hypothetical protein
MNEIWDMVDVVDDMIKEINLLADRAKYLRSLLAAEAGLKSLVLMTKDERNNLMREIVREFPQFIRE